MLAAQRTHDSSILQDDLEHLRENLVKVKTLLSKKHSQASTLGTEKE